VSDDENEPNPPEAGPEVPEVGSVAEEAAKLLGALQDWIRETGSGRTAPARSAGAGLAGAVRTAGDHVGHGQDCVYCPLCQAVNIVRATSPEAKQHLAGAATSLLRAAQAILDAHTAPPEPAASPRERIEVDDDGVD
jgi:hypothetical protein